MTAERDFASGANTKVDIPGLSPCHKCGKNDPFVYTYHRSSLPALGEYIHCECGGIQQVTIDGLRPVTTKWNK